MDEIRFATELDRRLIPTIDVRAGKSPLSCLAIAPKIELELELAPLFFPGKELSCSRGMHLAGNIETNDNDRRLRTGRPIRTGRAKLRLSRGIPGDSPRPLASRFRGLRGTKRQAGSLSYIALRTGCVGWRRLAHAMSISCTRQYPQRHFPISFSAQLFFFLLY
jgi:hypothetical protein